LHENKEMGSWIGSIELTPIDSGTGRNWRVDEVFSYVAQDKSMVTVPIGFVTDLASIPRFLWSLWPPEGLYTDAAVVHDCCYAQQFFTRLRCDQILLEAMEDLGVSWWTRHVIYIGVRIGGWMAWKKHEEENFLRNHSG
jgi:hypothetical protein